VKNFVSHFYFGDMRNEKSFHFFSAMLPGTELRLLIPLAFALGMSPAEACMGVIGIVEFAV